MTDMAPAGGAQPDQGQGAQAASEAPYSEYLDRIPEQVRADVEPIFKEWDSNVTRRFQEASEFRKQWEPFEQTGINQLAPDEVAWLAQFRDALNDPPTIQAWFDEYAQNNGLTRQEAEEQLAEQAQIDPDIQSTLERMLEERLAPFTQQLGGLTEWQQRQADAAAHAEIDRQITELQGKHGEFPREDVERFLTAEYIETDPEHAVEKAFADYQAFVARIEKQALAAKLGQPPAAEAGGAPVTVPEDRVSMKDANQIAKTILRQQMDAMRG